MLPGSIDGTAAIGVGGFVEGIDGSQNGPAVLVDEIDAAEVPAGVAHGHFAEVTVSRWNLEAHAFERDRPIALPLNSLGFQAKRVAERFALGAIAEHVGACLKRSTGEHEVSRCTARLYSISIHAWVAWLRTRASTRPRRRASS